MRDTEGVPPAETNAKRRVIVDILLVTGSGGKNLKGRAEFKKKMIRVTPGMARGVPRFGNVGTQYHGLGIGVTGG